MGRGGRRGVEGVDGELLELAPGPPGGHLAEAVPPARLRIDRARDLQEPPEQRVIAEHEGHQRPVLEGGDQLIANRGSADELRERVWVVIDPQARAFEYLLIFGRPLLVIHLAIGKERAAFPDALEVGSDSDVRLRPPESFLQGRRMGFGEVRLCLRQDEQRLGPALLAPPVVDPPQSVLDASGVVPPGAANGLRRGATLPPPR
jgi:hypothetical protein